MQKPMYFYRFWKAVLGFFARPLHRMRIIGRENVPESGRVVIACNHVNAIDPMLHAYCLKRDMHTIAKKELFDNPVFAWVLRRLGAFPVQRGRVDRRSVKQALDVLLADGLLLVFPEGTRSKTGELGVFKAGAAMFACETGSPVVPAAIVSPHGMRWFSPVTVVYGEPISPEELGGRPYTSVSLRRGTELIKSRVAALREEYMNES